MGVDIQVLDMPVLNTRDNQNGLTGKLITDIILKLLGYVAQRERLNIKTRQTEGIASAKQRGGEIWQSKNRNSERFYKSV